MYQILKSKTQFRYRTPSPSLKHGVKWRRDKTCFKNRTCSTFLFHDKKIAS